MSARPKPSIDDVVLAAIARPAADRLRHLFEACGDDYELYRAATSRLRSMSRTIGGAASVPPGVSAPAIAGGGEVGLRYRILDVLGEGGMGIVYLAEQLHPVNRRVALKVVKLGRESRAAAALFTAERQVLAIMNHPGIARVLEAGEISDGRLYVAMEYVPGRPVNEVCDRARLSIEDRLRLFLRVCEAVAHAHEKGIIHRDIKPSNILVSDEGGTLTPKMIDFGVAKVISEAGEPVTTGAAHRVVGSLAYMSPEQADGRSEAVDTRSDIYSLGVVLYELLADALPVDVRSRANEGFALALRRLREEVPAPPSRCIEAMGPAAVIRRGARRRQKLAREVRGDLDRVVMKALAKNPEHRYSSVSELGSDIGRYLAREPVGVSHPGRLRRLGLFARRYRSLVAGLATFTAALVVGVGVNSVLLLRYRHATTQAAGQRSDFLRLGDRIRLEACRESAAALVPPHPERIGAMEAWLAGPATELRDRLPVHEARLRVLARKGRRNDPDPGEAGRDDAERRFEHEVLSDLVDGLRRFVHPDPHVGLIAAVERRLAFARTVRSASIDAYEAQWRDAIASIRDRSTCPDYDGLEIVPQMGLVPIGRDRRSGLWEFGHLRSGRPATRAPDGRLRIDEGTGIVLVLVPGRCFEMGTRVAGPSTPSSGPASSLTFRDSELPSHRVCLDPFFLSKYEVTQGQWLGLTGANPSRSRPGTPEHLSMLQPVEFVEWTSAHGVMLEVGLDLPTEAQWEYAARAATTTPWWPGSADSSLAHAENLADVSAVEGGKPVQWIIGRWRDGFADTAPVGSFAANPFGFHDILGNVREWCRDRYGAYTLPVRPGDGLRAGTEAVERVTRGTDFTGQSFWARTANREAVDPEVRDTIGARPSRSLDRTGPPIGAESVEDVGRRAGEPR